MKATHPVHFREVQRFRDVWWVMALVFGVAALQWYIFLGQIIGGAPAGNRPAADGVVLLVWLLAGFVATLRAFGLGALGRVAHPAQFLQVHPGHEHAGDAHAPRGGRVLLDANRRDTRALDLLRGVRPLPPVRDRAADLLPLLPRADHQRDVRPVRARCADPRPADRGAAGAAAAGLSRSAAPDLRALDRLLEATGAAGSSAAEGYVIAQLLGQTS